MLNLQYSNFNKKVFLPLLSMLALLVVACSNYESFSDNPSFRLEFSQDTIAFDTLISTIPSSTKTLYAFNNNGNGMRISTIQLEGGAASRFRVNVDGRYLVGGEWHDFEVLKHDSLVIRIEMTPPEVGTNEPLYFEDKLHFTLENGAKQSVVLSGGSVDAYIQKGGLVVNEDMTLLTDKAYVIYDSLVVMSGATLTLTEGTTLMFHDKAALHVYGKLLVEGSIEKPVVLRGDRMDHMFDYLLYDNTPSRWEGVVIHKGSFGNEFYQCDLHSSLFGIIVEDTEQVKPDETKPSVTLDCCILHNIGGDGLQLNNCVSKVTNTQISNTLGHTVNINGGSHTFTYCTLAQFYPFTANRGDGLHLVSSEDYGEYGLLRKAHFINCVITGYGPDVIMGENIPQDGTCDYLFHHSFLNTPPVDDEEHFMACVFDQDKKKNEEEKLVREDNFVLFDTENFFYDFTPKDSSMIRSLADPNYAGIPAFDRKGVSRLADEGPDAGCYEYVAPPTEE
ncbi:MAG: hypothetical protein J6W03_01275 [Bacteroidaceae bacterium]|nr:hypothetical protein [Bacteroidaceae bacterium]